jgi:hypothetical protein
LVETVNERWTKSIPLVPGKSPQPDFAVGLTLASFSHDQLQKLRPAIGEPDTRSRIVAAAGLYFPFLMSEVKCGNAPLDVADRQNAHSASIAVNAIVTLYRAVSRQQELHREILAFSISHDDDIVRIYGHYPSIDGDHTSFHRHPVARFSISGDAGRNRWTAYKFTKNIYDIFVPLHVERIRRALDQLVEPYPRQWTAESDTSESSESDLANDPPTQTTEPVRKKRKRKGVK